jgi:hypothetical protein
MRFKLGAVTLESNLHYHKKEQLFSVVQVFIVAALQNMATEQSQYYIPNIRLHGGREEGPFNIPPVASPVLHKYHLIV